MGTKTKENRKYSPADICMWFGIPRTTLFRWEDQGDIPKAIRNKKGQRVYRQEHIHKLSDLVRQRLREEIDLATEYHPKNPAITQELLERLDMVKFYSSNAADKERGLESLKGLSRLKAFRPDTIRALMEEAFRRPAEDSVRQQIWELILFHDRQRRAH